MEEENNIMKIWDKINEKKIVLNNLVSNGICPEALKHSQELDLLINEYYKTKWRNKKIAD